MHYISHSGCKGVLSVGVGQDVDQAADDHGEGDSGGVVLPHEGEAHGSFEGDVGVVYFIEAFDFWGVDGVGIGEGELEIYFAVCVEGLLLGSDCEVDDLEGLLLWEGHCYEGYLFFFKILDIFLQSKSCHFLLYGWLWLLCFLLVVFGNVFITFFEYHLLY